MIIYYEDILYLCEHCGSDDLTISWRRIDDPLPTKYYTALVCDQCGTEHVRHEWQPLLSKEGDDNA